MTEATTETTVSCNPTSVFASSSCRATVSGYLPTGRVNWSQDGTSVSLASTSCTLSRGSCSVAMTGSSNGSAAITATYLGDLNNQGSSGASTVTVYPTLTIDSGQTASLTAVASGGSGSYASYAWSVPSGVSIVSGCTSSDSTCAVTSSTPGSYPLSVTVTDSTGASTSSSASLTVDSALSPPTASVSPATIGRANLPLSRP